MLCLVCPIVRLHGGCDLLDMTISLLHAGEVNAKCINACLAPVASLDGCSVVTVEGLGDCTKGFNPVQGAHALLSSGAEALTSTSWSGGPVDKAGRKMRGLQPCSQPVMLTEAGLP